MPPAPDPSDLPAPYRNPWGLLARDLRAVVASLRLKVQELWRRNGEGDLPVADFWPRRFRAWFWPLVLLLVTGILALLPLGAAAPGWRRPVVSQPVAQPSAEPVGADPVGADPRPPEPVPPAPMLPPAQAPPLAIEPPPLQLDPLMALLAEQDPDGLITAARPQPARSLLELELSDRFAALAPPLRSQWAESWLERASGLGYGSLELVDQGGRLLGRSALVGGGMIMFERSTMG